MTRTESGDRTLVILAYPDGSARAVRFRLDTERALHAEGKLDDVPAEALAGCPQVVIAAHPSLVVTKSIDVRIDREAADTPLTQGEFEGKLRQVHVRLWNEYRREAAEALGVSVIDTVLVAVRVRDVRVAGTEVLHPYELTGKHIELGLIVRFTTRAVFDRWQHAFSLQNGVFFTDPSYAILESTKGGTVLVADRAGTYLATRKNGEHRVLAFEWNVESLTGALAHAWELPSPVAEQILADIGAPSPALAEWFEKLYKPQRASLESALKRAKLRGSAAVVSSAALPIPVPGSVGALSLVPYDASGVAEAYDFALDASGLPRDAGNFVAPFLEFYYHNRYAEINRWLKRRVHWLTTEHS